MARSDSRRPQFARFSNKRWRMKFNEFPVIFTLLSTKLSPRNNKADPNPVPNKRFNPTCAAVGFGIIVGLVAK